MAVDFGAVRGVSYCSQLENSPKMTRRSSNSGKETGHDYEEVLEVLGFGKTQMLVLISVGLLIWMVINETMGLGIIAIASQCDFQTSSMDKALLTAASFLGIFCSSYFWGYLSDVIGRRKIITYSTLAGNGVSFVSMFIASFRVFVVFRFIIGILIAGASSTTYAYLGEFVTNKHRPIVITYASMFVGISMTYVPIVAYLVLSMDWSIHLYESLDYRPWRLLIFFNLLPGLVGACLLLFMVETPKFLLSISQQQKAYDATNWICRLNTGNNLDSLGIYKLNKEEKTNECIHATKSPFALLDQMWQQTKPLFKRPHVVNFLISCLIMFGIFLSSSGLGLWFPDIQNRLGASTATTKKTICEVIEESIESSKDNVTLLDCDDTINNKSFIDSMIIGSMYIAGYIIFALIIGPIGRKTVLFAATFISAVCGLLTLWLLDSVAIVVCFCLFLMLPGVCVSVMSSAVVDIAPTYLRGKMVCVALMMGRLGAIIGSNITGVLLEAHCRLTFGFFSIFMLLCGILTLFLPI